MKSKIYKHKQNHKNKFCKKHILSIGLLFMVVNAFSQTVPSPTENYVYTKTYLSKPGDPVQKTPIETIQYFDGLGRPKQAVNVQASTKGNDLVTTSVYNNSGREVDNYLPVPMTTANGAIQNLNPAGVVTYYTSPQNTTTKDFALTDANPFSHKTFERSPLDRIQQQLQVGNGWRSRPVEFDYSANTTADKVMRFWSNVNWTNQNNNDLRLETSKYFGDSQLYKNTIIDEDRNATIEFKNGEGQTLLVRKMLNGSPVDTYYVYNEYNNLAFVISPEASKKIDTQLLSGGVSVLDPATKALVTDLCYQYKYDDKSRLIEKKLPGKGWEYMVYDKADRLVLTQDEIMRPDKRWLFTKYDKFGRVIYTGTTTDPGTRAGIQAYIEYNFPVNAEGAGTFTQNGLTIEYTNSGAFPTYIENLLSVNYYDSYPSGTVFPTGDAILGAPILKDTFPQGVTQSTKSLPTASFVKNIEDDKWTKNYTFYDRKGRSIGTYSYNHLGGYTKYESLLDFTGLPQKTVTYHKRLSSNPETIVEENFTYDSQNRLTVHTHKVNSDAPVTLAKNHYNEIGQLDWKEVGGDQNGNNPLQTVNYKYNIRGWMTDLNDPANSTTMGTDLFGFKIRYNEPIAGLSTPNVNFPALQVTPKYNGNIAEIDWNGVESTGIAPLDNPYRYGYVYDGLNRLQAGFFQDPANPSKGTNNEIIEQYDLNGNIIKLKRFAYKPKSTVPAKIDDLTYTYTGGGNQVTNIADASGNINGYEGGNGLIEYDVNGNMTKMPDKGITGISYNYLNLPEVIEQTNITSYSYRADGVKTKKEFELINALGSNTITTEYLDGFVYTTPNLENLRMALDERDPNTVAATRAGEEESFVDPGIVPDNPPTDARLQLAYFPTAEGFYDYENSKYIYQYKDHLGNVRLSYAQDPASGRIEVLDRNDYYPFGMNFVGYNSVFDTMGSLVNYKYNGKELQESGMYDYGWRLYMPDLGRWNVIDPLAEKTLEPYAYVYNNPVMLVDPTGMFGEDPKKTDPNKVYEGGEIQEVKIIAVKPVKTLSVGDIVSNQVFGVYKDESWKNIGNASSKYWTSVANSPNATAVDNFDKGLWVGAGAAMAAPAVAYLWSSLGASGASYTILGQTTGKYLQGAVVRGLLDYTTQYYFKKGDVDYRQLGINMAVGGGKGYQNMAKLAAYNLMLNTGNNFYNSGFVNFQRDLPMNAAKTATGALGGGIGIIGGDIVGSIYGNGMDAYLGNANDNYKK